MIFADALNKVARLFGRFSESMAMLPQGHMDSDLHAHYRAGSNWKRVIAASDAEWPLPISLGSRSVFFDTLPAHWPELGILDLEQAVLAGPGGLLHDSEGVRLPWHSWYRNNDPSARVSMSQWKAARNNRLTGVTLSIMSEFCDRNYCHFLFDSLPRLKVFQDSGHSMDEIDQVVVPGKLSTRRKQMLMQLGINERQIVWFGETNGVLAERMLCPSFPGYPRCYPRWSINFIRDAFPARVSSKGQHRRLFVSRKGFDRDVANFKQLLPILDKFDFEIVSPHELSDSTSYFAEASIVVGPHGAGMADIAYCSNQASVLELVPDRNCHPYYYSLAVSAGAKYFAIKGTSIENQPSRGGRSSSDFVVDVIDFEDGIKHIVELQSKK